MPTTPSTQPTEGSASARIEDTSKVSIGVVSPPPQRLGWNIWKKPASSMSWMVSSSTRGWFHCRAERSLSTGTKSWARCTYADELKSPRKNALT